MGGKLKFSTLRIEPHRVKPDTSREYFVREEGIILWRIWLNDNLIAEHAHPFTATNSVLELTADRNFPFFGDGKNHVSVRRIANYILWTPLLRPEWMGWSSVGVENNHYFAVETYTNLCNDALAISSKLDEKFVLRTKDESWQMLEVVELAELLKDENINWIDDIAIYREPADQYDSTGSFIWRRMKQAIDSMTDFVSCDEPEKQIELRIGLDDTEFREAIWHIGKVDGQFAVCFEQFPAFPLWIRSSAFDRVFNQELFVKELA
jgi:hypothetical protein